MNMTKAKDWADKRADQVVNSIWYAQDPEAAIAVALRDVADECADIAYARQKAHGQLGCRFTCDDIRSRFPRRDGDGIH